MCFTRKPPEKTCTSVAQHTYAVHLRKRATQLALQEKPRGKPECVALAQPSHCTPREREGISDAVLFVFPGQCSGDGWLPYVSRAEEALNRKKRKAIEKLRSSGYAGAFVF